MAFIGQTTLSGLVNSTQPSLYNNSNFPTSFYNPSSTLLVVGGYYNAYIGYNFSADPSNPSSLDFSPYQQFTDNTFFGSQQNFNTDDFFNDYYLAIHANFGQDAEIIKITRWIVEESYPTYVIGVYPSFSTDNPLVNIEVERGVGTTSAGYHTSGDLVELHDTLQSAEESILGDLAGYDGSSDPVYFEDYDGNNDGELTIRDVSNWNQVGRPDIGNEILNFILTEEYPPNTPLPPIDEPTGGGTGEPSLPQPIPVVNPLISYDKRIIVNQPKLGDRSQYNFNQDDNQDDGEYEYENSTGLPKNNDKFQNKDLFTNCVGDEVNEAIIEKNLKFEGDSRIHIENLYISNTGVDGTTKSNHIIGWIFSGKAYGGDPSQDGYSTIKNKMKDEWKFYSQGFGNKSQGTDIGNIVEVEQTPIVSNFSSDSDNVELGDIEGMTMAVDDLPEAFKLSSLGEVDLLTSLFNQREINPIYIVIYMKGHKKLFWPFNTDERRRRYDVFKISNTDLFDKVGTTDIGKVTQLNFTSATTSRTGDGGGGAQQAAWRVTNLRLNINTSAGVKNIFPGVSNYENIISEVLPANSINENTLKDFEWVGFLNPKLQLDNIQDSNSSDASSRHLDFIPITTFGFSQNNQLGYNYVDLQSYNIGFNSIMRASAPLNVTFDIDFVNPDGNVLPPNIDLKYYYFVIDWNDTDDKFKTIDDWLESRPENVFDYLELQNQNLYKLTFVYNSSLNYDIPKLNNIYTTPGIKNIKYIMFSVFDGNGGADDSPDFEVGRWKLCTSRIYLDIPPNRYPDFSEVGGNNYTTIPWPFTTPIIGGVSDDSKYKKSIQDTLSGGKIGEFDIIDEKFLVDDLDNDEMGKNIETMDLEQCRYFNKPYGINKLINIEDIIFSSPQENSSYFFNTETQEEYLETNLFDLSDQPYGFIAGDEYGLPLGCIDLGNNLLSQWYYDELYGLRWSSSNFTETIEYSTDYAQTIRNHTYKLYFEINIYDEWESPDDIPEGTQIEFQHGTDMDERTTSTFFQLSHIDIYNGSLLNGFYPLEASYTAQSDEQSILLIKAPVGVTFDIKNIEIVDSDEPPNLFTDTTPEYLSTLPFPKYFDEFDINNDGAIQTLDITTWIVNGRPDISALVNYLFVDNVPFPTQYTYPEDIQDWVNVDNIPIASVVSKYDDYNYWSGDINKFPEESSVGQIFITDNQDLELKQSCKLELNTGNITGKSILDTSGNTNKGLLIGDYKIKKVKKGQDMRRDSFIKVPKKTGNKDGAL